MIDLPRFGNLLYDFGFIIFTDPRKKMADTTSLNLENNWSYLYYSGRLILGKMMANIYDDE